MITLNKLAKKCLEIAFRRGKVNRYTSGKAYMCHISTEWRELVASTSYKSEHLPQYSEHEEEAADVIICTLTYLERIGCKDIEQLIRDKIEFNDKRKD